MLSGVTKSFNATTRITEISPITVSQRDLGIVPGRGYVDYGQLMVCAVTVQSVKPRFLQNLMTEAKRILIKCKFLQAYTDTRCFGSFTSFVSGTATASLATVGVVVDSRRLPNV